jgi:hypothetical protein
LIWSTNGRNTNLGGLSQANEWISRKPTGNSDPWGFPAFLNGLPRQLSKVLWNQAGKPDLRLIATVLDRVEAAMMQFNKVGYADNRAETSGF